MTNLKTHGNWPNAPKKTNRRKDRVCDLPPELRGPSQNRYGGQQTQKMKPFFSSKFGPANNGRRFNRQEVAEFEGVLRIRNML